MHEPPLPHPGWLPLSLQTPLNASRIVRGEGKKIDRQVAFRVTRYTVLPAETNPKISMSEVTMMEIVST